MSIAFNESAIAGRHTITYRIRDSHRGNPVRKIEVLATREEIGNFVRDGYLVRERLVPMEAIERLRAAIEECYAQDKHLEQGGGRDFGGVFIRHLHEKHPLFLGLMNFPPAVSVARALFGPSVQLRGFTGRICYPESPNQETEWHFHQRIVPEPLPPMFTPSNTMDVLLYLDDVTDVNGPLCVLPGSHRWAEKDLGRGVFEDQNGQAILRLPVGSMALCHGSLWHRGMPTRPGCTIRRLLLWGYGSCWIKPSIYGVKPQDGLASKLLKNSDLDEETKELLGVTGYM